MICLNNTDVLEGGASIDGVVEYTFFGLVDTTFTQLASGVMNTTLTTTLYTAPSSMSIVSMIIVNTHTSAVNVTLRIDPTNGGNPRYIIPKTIELGAGYSLHTDGTKFTVANEKGETPASMSPHTIASHSDTTGTGAELNTLTDNSMADTLHRHSGLSASDGSPDPALSVDASGNVGIGRTPTTHKLEVEGTIEAKDDVKVGGFLNLGSRAELTISGGVVTATQTRHTIDTEGDATTDNLDTINGGSDEDLLIISSADTTRTIIVRDASSGGNIQLAGNSSFTMDNSKNILTLFCRDGTWLEISRSDNG